MSIAIIVSEKDIAGMNIHERLIELGGLKNAKIHLIKDDSIFHENIDKGIDAELFIFATRHKSESGKPTLCAHTQGNFSEDNSFGGRKKTLCTAPALYLKEAIKKMNELNNIEFEVCQEATHHGPYLEKPSMFIEIGSTEKEWRNKKAGEIIAKTIIHLCTAKIKECESAIGIGGLHYMLNFMKAITDSNIAVGHCCPKYNLENLDEEMIAQMIEKTIPTPESAILDWKGLGENKQRVMGLCEKTKLKIKKTKDY